MTIEEVSDSEILLEAADHLEEYGWAKGAGNLSNKRCAMNVICYVSQRKGAGVIWHRVGQKFAHFLGLKNEYEIPTWNDQPERTQEEVVRALRTAATHAYED